MATGRLSERSFAIVGEVARELGRTSVQVVVSWSLRDRAVVSYVLGSRTPVQLEDNLGAIKVELSNDQLAPIGAASTAPRGFPHEMLVAPTNAMGFGGVKVERRG